MSDPKHRVMEAWRSYRAQMPTNAPQIQFDECRRAFFAGAAALFGEITNLDPGTEPTDADLDKMSAIKAELDAFPSIAYTTRG